jgi:hypothetical protein
MRRLALALVLAVIAAGSPAQAADSTVTVVAPATPVVVAPATVEVVPAAPPGDVVVLTKPAPHVQYGCKRVWRCDAQVCEWRRGCWGIYGYMEGPYYSQELAQRQWERDGWPMPGTGPRSRTRTVIQPSVAK